MAAAGATQTFFYRDTARRALHKVREAPDTPDALRDAVAKAESLVEGDG